ncbi:MAG: glutamate formiminotransferase / 5-formyltetrahydrofolate cyclo-ligase [Solirubrobacteraceae bacterium]|nr:glutamate formiminotransferase / 5-formyltetrahydrofolate cyclo-ligase [Solirubrobacteraceae bacterium]
MRIAVQLLLAALGAASRMPQASPHSLRGEMSSHGSAGTPARPQVSLVPMDAPILLAVPNVSEGRDETTIAALRTAFAGAESTWPQGKETGSPGEHAPGTGAPRARLIDVHSDADHHRSVFTLAARPGRLADAVLAGARVAVEQIDVMSRADLERSQAGQHPHVGALDVAPVVYVDERSRGTACAEALVIADRLGEELDVPVFLYGELTEADSTPARTRAQLRRGGAGAMAGRIARGELRPDFGPPRMHPSAGATLVAARPPLVAFNLQLASPATIADAQRIAATVREGGSEGLPGVRAIAVALSGDIAQVSMNVERPFEVSLAMVAEAVGRHARIAGAELVGLAPRAALEGFPASIEIQGHDPERHVLENALGC